MRGRSRPATCRQTPVMTSVLGPMPSAGGPRAEALAQVGGLDESFLLYAEETDWARRAANLGWRHALVPQVTARHLVAGTRSDSARRDAHFHASQERYHRKHFGAAGWQVTRLVVIGGAALRSLALPGERRDDARRRLRRYLAGPLTVEAQLTRQAREVETGWGRRSAASSPRSA